MQLKTFTPSGVSRFGTSSIRHVMLKLMQFERECRELRVTESTKRRHFHPSPGSGTNRDRSRIPPGQKKIDDLYIPPGLNLSASCVMARKVLSSVLWRLRCRRISSIDGYYVFKPIKYLMDGHENGRWIKGSKCVIICSCIRMTRGNSAHKA